MLHFVTFDYKLSEGMGKIRSFIESLIKEPRNAKVSYKILSDGCRFKFKRLCPYCGGNMTYVANSWEEDDLGFMMATHFDADCDSMPDFDSDDYHEWDIIHSQSPYVYQMPVDIMVRQFLADRVRFVDYHAPKECATIIYAK